MFRRNKLLPILRLIYKILQILVVRVMTRIVLLVDRNFGGEHNASIFGAHPEGGGRYEELCMLFMWSVLNRQPGGCKLKCENDYTWKWNGERRKRLRRISITCLKEPSAWENHNLLRILSVFHWDSKQIQLVCLLSSDELPDTDCMGLFLCISHARHPWNNLLFFPTAIWENYLTRSYNFILQHVNLEQAAAAVTFLTRMWEMLVLKFG
jgi:hypothetical protein